MARSPSLTISATGSDAAEPQWRLLVALSLAHFLTDISQGIIPALGVFLRDDYGLTYAEVGLLSLVLAIGSSFVQPVAGIISDRNPRGWMIPIGMVAVGAGLAGMSFSTRFGPLLIFVALIGCGVALFHPEGMRFARSLVGRRLATGMAVFQVGGNLGVGLGPLVAAIVWAWLGLRGILTVGMAPLIWAMVIIMLLPRIQMMVRTQHPAPQPAATAAAAPPPAAPTHVDQWGAEIRTLIAVILRSTFQISLTAFLPLYYVDVLGVAEQWSTVPTSVYWVAGAMGTLTTGPIADRIGVRRYFIMALSAIVPLHLLALIVPTPIKLLIFAIQGFTIVSTMAVSIVLCQNYLPNRMALASGLNVGLGQGLGGVGPAVVGLVADRIGLVPTMFGLGMLPLLAALVASTLPKVRA